MFRRVVSVLVVATTSFALRDGALDFSTVAMQANRQTQESSSMIHGLDTDLSKLRLLLRRATSKSFLQVAEAPKSHTTATEAADAMKQMSALGFKSFQPMAELMHGMYDSWKDKISDVNKREQSQKADLEHTISGLETRKSQTLAGCTDDATRKDAAETYDRMERYWKKQRAISHRQYHTSLKILHAGMQKFKGVMGALEDAGQGKKPSAKDLRAIGVMPEVALIQTKLVDMSEWVTASAKELASA